MNLQQQVGIMCLTPTRSAQAEPLNKQSYLVVRTRMGKQLRKLSFFFVHSQVRQSLCSSPSRSPSGASLDHFQCKCHF